MINTLREAVVALILPEAFLKIMTLYMLWMIYSVSEHSKGLLQKNTQNNKFEAVWIPRSIRKKKKQLVTCNNIFTMHCLSLSCHALSCPNLPTCPAMPCPSMPFQGYMSWTMSFNLYQYISCSALITKEEPHLTSPWSAASLHKDSPIPGIRGDRPLWTLKLHPRRGGASPKRPEF